jgi:hypothetical protein
MAPRPTELDPRVDAIASHIARRLADAAVEDMRARYDFGRVLHTARKQSRGAGEQGVLRVLARRLGVDASALRRYAQVSDVISAREFDGMLKLRNARGEPLTWSHVELLARVRSAERRHQLAIAVVREELSVRDLSARVRAHGHGHG